ncbi:MAG: AAA family ATPase [Patescibacteria group bacterium]
MTNNLKKIEYYNLREETLARRLPAFIGRTQEMERLNRIVDRRVNNNVLIIGPDGIGKTTLVYGWVRHLQQYASYESCAFLQLDIEHIYALDNDYGLEAHYSNALLSLPESVLFIDDFGREVYKNPALMQRISRLYKQLLKKQHVHVVLTLEPHEYAWLESEYPAFVHLFETIRLKNQSAAEYTRILSRAIPRLNKHHGVIVPDNALKEIIAYADRFPILGQMPQAAIQVLDEAIAHSAARASRVLEQDAIAHVVEIKTGIPKTRLTHDELDGIRTLEKRLNARVVNQRRAVKKIATTLQRAKLGLRNPSRPLGSFLLLGPSGVGKTETAKCVAELMFDSAESFIRFDMSEFQQDHTVQRLIGAPAGYVGYEEGGALTNALRKEPYSIILLDEIEKAHPKVFDVFLQVLDDGRISSGQNETVDARNAIIMATSNVAVSEILEACRTHPTMDEQILIREKVLPVLTKTFRLEFINRFDAIILYQPLTIQGLVQIALLEIRKVEQRLKQHKVRFEIEPVVLEQQIRRIADPRFGARPIKRFVEETCETLLMQSLLGANAARL